MHSIPDLHFAGMAGAACLFPMDASTFPELAYSDFGYAIAARQLSKNRRNALELRFAMLASPGQNLYHSTI